MFREAVASAWGTKVVSIASVLMVAGMVLAVLLTAGRTVGAQQGVIATLDDAGTRSIVVRAQQDAGLDASVLARLQGVSSIAWSGGFGAASDVVNAEVVGGEKVPLRPSFGIELSSIGVQGSGLPGVAYGSDAALHELGLESAAGAVVGADGAEYAIGGRIDVPDHLEFLEPLLILPSDRDIVLTSEAGSSAQMIRGEPLAILVVVAEEASSVSTLTETVRGLLDVDDPGSITVATSEQLAELRGLIDAQLSGAGQALVLAIFGLTAVLVAATLYALVMMRRRDFGRRRALGASRSLIAALVLTQVATLSVCGAIIGAAASFAALLASGDPQPPASYYCAIAVLAVVVALVAALVPAAAAATRDPARELRVP